MQCLANKICKKIEKGTINQNFYNFYKKHRFLAIFGTFLTKIGDLKNMMKNGRFLTIFSPF